MSAGEPIAKAATEKGATELLSWNAIYPFSHGGPRQLDVVQTDRWAKCVRIGCFSPRYQTFFTGLIAEVLVYDRVLSETDRDRFHAYLACKWQLR